MASTPPESRAGHRAVTPHNGMPPGSGSLDPADFPVQETKVIRVLLAEDMDLLRGALVTLLSDEDDIEVVADMTCDERVVPAAMSYQPDVAVLDVDPSCPQGFATFRALRTRMPSCRIVALVAAQPVGLLQRVLEHHVLGAVDKNAPTGRLLQAIRGVADGEMVVDPKLAVAALSAGANPFTQRELEVLRLAADGASGPEIADRLCLSNGTVRNYLSKVMSKTRARSRIDAIRIVREGGWL